jgi:hypothetical protein
MGSEVVISPAACCGMGRVSGHALAGSPANRKLRQSRHLNHSSAAAKLGVALASPPRRIGQCRLAHQRYSPLRNSTAPMSLLLLFGRTHASAPRPRSAAVC